MLVFLDVRGCLRLKRECVLLFSDVSAAEDEVFCGG